MGGLCSPLAALLLLVLPSPVHVFSRIIGGQDAQEGRWPWHVSVEEYYHHVCGGSLVSAQGVVSAAHCFDPHIVIHPDYNQSTFFADIALVQLMKPVNFTDTIRPISLPGPSTQFPAGGKCWVTDWGSIRWGCGDTWKPPKTLHVPLITVSTCKENVSKCKYQIQDDMLCAGSGGDCTGPCEVGYLA
nr:tryptase-like [Chrysemys picta bellii]